MTERQAKALYWPAWGKVAWLHGWRLEQRRLAGPRLESWGGPETTAVYLRVWQHADSAALRHCRAPLPDDLRHGVHVAALGRDKSSADLTNIELDRVLCVLRLLADPDDLRAMEDWLDPDTATKRRRIGWLKACVSEAYLWKVVADMHPTTDLELLNPRQIEDIYDVLRHRPHGFKPGPVYDASRVRARPGR